MGMDSLVPSVLMEFSMGHRTGFFCSSRLQTSRSRVWLEIEAEGHDRLLLRRKK